MTEPKDSLGTVLLIDDEPDLLESCARILEDEGYECTTTTNSESAIELVREIKPSVVVTDFKMPGKNGMDILKEVKGEFAHTPVVMISAFATIEGVVKAVKVGAFDYLAKPFSSNQLIITIHRAREHYNLKMENASLKSRLQKEFIENGIVGKHPKIVEITEMINKVGLSDSSVLINGETGVGKELVARTIHAYSQRSEKKFLPINCSTLTEEMLEAAPLIADGDTVSEQYRENIFEAANGGTLYFEKAEDLNLGIQAKLVRILQDKKILRRSEWEWMPMDTRIISSCASGLRSAVNRKEFLENLYYSLNVVYLQIPSLRERKDDIGILCDHFLAELARDTQEPAKTLHPETLARLFEYDWPGNVWELKNVIETTASMSKTRIITIKSLPKHIRRSNAMFGLSFKEAKKRWQEQFEKHYLENLLFNCKGNISQASENAGIARMSLYRMLKRNNLTRLAIHERSPFKNKGASKLAMEKRKR